LLLLGCLLAGVAFGQTNNGPLTRETVAQAQRLIGLNFSERQLDQLLPGLSAQLGNYEAMRRFPLSNGVPPALQFNPLPIGFKFETRRRKFKASPPPRVRRPANLDDLAFVPSPNCLCSSSRAKSPPNNSPVCISSGSSVTGRSLNVSLR